MRILFPVLVLLAFIFESTLAVHLAWTGGRPLLVLATVVYYSLVYGATAGTIYGTGLGFLVDLTVISSPGLTMLSFAVVGFLVGSALDSLYKDNGLTQAGALFFGALLHSALTFLLVTRLDFQGLPAYVLRHGLVTGLLTALSGPLVLAVIERLLKKDIYFDAHRVVFQHRRPAR